MNQLSEELKNEFDVFLNASFNFSMNNKKPDWNFLTLGDYDVEEQLNKKPEPVIEMFGRSAAEEPRCRKKKCLFYLQK